MPESRATGADRIEYVADMLMELRRMPDGDRHALLVCLLEMALIEARELLNDNKSTGGGSDERDAVA